MKKLMIECMVLLTTGLFASCGQNNNDGTYTAHLKNEYSIADDTIVIENDIVTNRIGYNFIRNGVLKHRHNEVKRWRLNEPGSPVITIKNGTLMMGIAVYQKIR